MNVPLTAAEEAKLVARARAHGTTPEDLIRRALAAILAVPETIPESKAPAMTPEEREKALDELFDGVTTPGGIQEGAFHRENWYR